MTSNSTRSRATSGVVPPIVLGGGITALGVIRSFGEAGLQPYVVAPRADLCCRSRWVRGRRLAVRESGDPTTLVAALDRAGFERAVLVPCSDAWVEVAAQLPPQTTARFAVSVPTSDVVRQLVDKWQFAETLVRFDIPHPPTHQLTGEEQLDRGDLPSFFIKPRDSLAFSRRFARKAFRFDTREEAAEYLRQITTAGLQAVLQEYVPGPPTAHLFVDGFVDREGVVRGLFVRRRVRMFPPDFGNSSLTESIPVADGAAAVESLERLLDGLGYRGGFSAEFKRDDRDGVHKLLEVNSRPWWYIGFAAHCGVDVSAMIYRDALGLPVATVTSYAVGERCVLLHSDVRAYLEMRRAGQVGLVEWVRSWWGATPTLFARNDPLPALALPVLAWRRFRSRRPAGVRGVLSRALP